MNAYIQIADDEIGAGIYKGKLVSILNDGHEYMHGAEKPDILKEERDRKGWNNSEIIMFPVIGKPKNYEVVLNGKKYAMDQHGVSRALPFDIHSGSADFVRVFQKYDGKQIFNPKSIEGKDNPVKMRWVPYFIEKTISLEEEAVVVKLTLQNDSDRPMPYEFGWHPAFRSDNDYKNEKFLINGKEYSLEKVLEESILKGALTINDANHVFYTNQATGNGLDIITKGFNKIMLWKKDKDSGMFCIEPVTDLPVPLEQRTHFTDAERTYRQLEPSARETFEVIIKPF